MAGLTFKGKSFVQNHHLLVKYHQLIPRKDKSLTDKVSLRDNLIIHGDNLKALKALLPMYGGKVKCIYIDPPYNTGNENWVYNDNVNSPMMQDWLGKVVDREDLTRHDKWLCMMMPRLKLLYELLTDDGVIFISVDDNEVHRLRCLMDDLFGEERQIGQLIWRCRNFPDTRPLTGVSVDHEYILAYGKTESARLRGKRRSEGKYSNPDNDPRGDWTSCSLLGKATREERPNLHYDLVNPDTGDVYPPEPLTGWICGRETMARKIAENRILWPKKSNGRPREKVFLSELKSGFLGYPSIIDGVFTSDGTDEMRQLFGEKAIVFPKPSLLLKELIEQVATGTDIVLDSFAGSGPTAQAVMQLNEEDGGKRRFILIECEDYADKVTAERVRRVIKGVADAENESLRTGLGGTFSYFDLGPAIEMESILSGEDLPTYSELARYVFYTATGEEFDEAAVDEKRHFIGESKQYLVYLFYAPDLEYLKKTALTLDRAKALGAYAGKRRLVFAPTKYLDQEHLDEMRIDFAQLPFEIYQLAK
jgi:adenine-specific DNA-methyltransferase